MIDARLDLPPVAGPEFFESLAPIRGGPAPDWLTAALRTAYGLGPGARTALISVSENASYLVRDGDAPVGVARLQQPGYQQGEAQLRSEIDWVDAVHRSGRLRVPRPLTGADGRQIHSLRSPRGVDVTVVMYEYVPGDILQDVADATPWFEELGRLTARLHAQSREWRRPAGFDRFRWDLPDLLGPGSRWGDWRAAALSPARRGLLEWAESTAASAVGAVRRTPRSWGLVHSDLRPTNVMHDGDRLTVIDFDDAGFSWFLYDFAGALTFQEHEPAAPAMAAHWIRGYRSEATLTPADVELACHLSMVRSLTMLGWSTTHRPDALPPNLRGNGGIEKVVDAVCTVAERYAASRTWLAEQVV